MLLEPRREQKKTLPRQVRKESLHAAFPNTNGSSAPTGDALSPADSEVPKVKAEGRADAEEAETDEEVRLVNGRNLLPDVRVRVCEL